MSEYIRTNKFDTNECPNIFVKEKLIRTNVRIYIRDQYIRIFEYSNIFVTLWVELCKEVFEARSVCGAQEEYYFWEGEARAQKDELNMWLMKAGKKGSK